MDPVRTSETSVYFDETTRRCSPKSCHIQTLRLKNLKSHIRQIPNQDTGMIPPEHEARPLLPRIYLADGVNYKNNTETSAVIFIKYFSHVIYILR
jgi:hypothetical protein